VTGLSRRGDAPNLSCKGGGGRLPDMWLNSVRTVLAAYCSSSMRPY